MTALLAVTLVLSLATIALTIDDTMAGKRKSGNTIGGQNNGGSASGSSVSGSNNGLNDG